MRRSGTASSSAAAKRPPQTIDTYIQAAISANAPSITANAPSLPPKSSRRRRKKQANVVPIVAKEFVKLPSPPIAAKVKRRKRKSKFKNEEILRQKSSQFRVRGLVTAEELENDDEAEEVQEEIRNDFSRFGELQDFAIILQEREESGFVTGDVVVTFCDAKNAIAAFAAFDQKVFGGKTVVCDWEVQNEENSFVVLVDGMVTAEELEDPDEAVEVEEEMMQMFNKFGQIDELAVETTGKIKVKFRYVNDAQKVAKEMNGSLYGGRPVFAQLVNVEPKNDVEAESAKKDTEAQKICASSCILQLTENVELKNLVATFLKRLADLQERAHTQNPRNDKRLRRFVLGMHEVRRGLLVNKIRLLIIATDVDECDAVTGNIVELMTIAREKEVPVVSPMKRRKLGSVLQKNVRISCVGIYSVEGANELFQQILRAMKTTNSR